MSEDFITNSRLGHGTRGVYLLARSVQKGIKQVLHLMIGDVFCTDFLLLFHIELVVDCVTQHYLSILFT